MNQSKVNETRAPQLQDTEFYRALDCHLHKLKNLLWPLSIKADCAPLASASVELAAHLRKISVEVLEALEVADRMSDLLQRRSENYETRKLGCIAPSGRTPHESPLRILCVIEDPGVRGTLARMMAYLGHDVDVSSSGAEGRQAIASTAYQVVVADHRLADDIHSWNVFENRATPVLWLSGSNDASRNANLHDAVFPGRILAMPLSLAVLRKALEGISMPVAIEVV